MGNKVKRFEDLIAWQKSMTLAEHAYDTCTASPFRHDFAFTNQVHSAALSIPSNIAEGFERGSPAEFHRFLGIANGSCAELRTQIYLARRIGHIDDETERALISEAERVAQIIGKLRSTVPFQRATPRMPHAADRMPDGGGGC